MPYDTSQFSPGYGGKINSAGNVVNIADAFDTTTSSLKVETVPATNMSGLLTFQSGAVAIGNGTVQDVTGYDILTLNVTISATATVTYEGSIDGTNWITTPFYLMNGQANNSSASSISGLRFAITGFKFFRARVSAWTSGTVDVSGYATIGNLTQITAVGTFGNVDTNAAGTNNLMGVGGFNLLYDGTNWARQSTAGRLNDGNSGQLGVQATGLCGFNGSTWDRVKTVNTGQLRATLYNSSGLELNANQSTDGAAGTAFLSSSLSLFNGSTFDRVRVGKIYKYIEYLNLANATATTVWTPASGKKFRLMGVMIGLGATNGLVHLRDGAGGSAFFTARDAAAASIQFSFGNGYLSSTANNVLEVYNATGSTINVWVHAWGTEE